MASRRLVRRGRAPCRAVRTRSVLVTAVLACLAAFSSLASDTTATTVIDLVSSEPRFSTLVGALRDSRLVSRLDRTTRRGVTLFAPTDDAFDASNRTRDRVDRALLEYHVLLAAVPFRNLTDGRLLETSLPGPPRPAAPALARGGGGPVAAPAGQRVKITRGADGRVFVGGCRVEEGELTANNGVVHVLETVLAPPVDLVKTIANLEDVSILNNALKISGLSQLLSSNSPFTVFAPLDRAFDEIPPLTKQYLLQKHAKDDLKNVLKYHVHEGAYYIDELPEGKTQLRAMAEGTHELTKPKNGGEVTYDRVAIQNVDIIASNGAVHVIPRLFLPSSFKMDTMKYLIATGRTKFVDLLVDAGLSDFLTKRKSTSPLTILTVPNEALEHSSRPMGQMLYHIVPGLHESDSLQDNDLLRTALKSDRLRDENQVVQVMVLDNNGEREVFINDAKIMGDPVIADGVVIYTLSHLLELPVDPLQAIVNDLDLSTFATAVHTAQLAHTVREQQGTTIFVPSNQAFLKNSALMSYLLLPESEKKLAAVLQYHIATQIVYSSEFPQPGKNQNELMMPTLVGQNITVTVGQNGDDLGLHGSQRHEARFQSPRPRNRPTSNGNMFVIDRVLLPDISITVRNLLDGLKMPTFDHLLSEYLSADPEVPALDSSNNEPFTLLVPNESAFASVDIGELGRDPARITCSMRMYFVRGRPEIADGAVWETMCPDVWFKVHSTGDDKWELEMSDKRGSAIRGDDLGRAHVGRRGEARNGDLYEIDRFFTIPVHHGLAWYWISLIVLGVLGLISAGFGLWHYLQVRRQRAGYQEVPGRD